MEEEAAAEQQPLGYSCFTFPHQPEPLYTARQTYAGVLQRMQSRHVAWCIASTAGSSIGMLTLMPQKPRAAATPTS